jgi:hypothetical protein
MISLKGWRVEEDLKAITSKCSADFATGLHRLLACAAAYRAENLTVPT